MRKGIAVLGAFAVVVSGVVAATDTAALAGGSTLFAAPTTSGNCGSALTACSLATALTEATAGSTILLEGGTYSGDLSINTRDTTAAAPVTIEADATANSIPGVYIDGGGTGYDLRVGDMYLSLQNIMFQGSGGNQAALLNNDGGSVTVDSCVFENNDGSDGGGIDNGDTLEIGGEPGGRGECRRLGVRQQHGRGRRSHPQ